MNYKLCKIVFVLCMKFITGQNITDVNNLSAKLLDGYNVNTRPISNQNDILNITMTVVFLRIRNFEEVEGKLTTVLGLFLNWQDDSLKWEPAEHNNIRSIRFPESSVWTPEISVINSIGKINAIGDPIRVRSPNSLQFTVKLIKTRDCFFEKAIVSPFVVVGEEMK